jgi:hypothetical protein
VLVSIEGQTANGPMQMRFAGETERFSRGSKKGRLEGHEPI